MDFFILSTTQGIRWGHRCQLPSTFHLRSLGSGGTGGAASRKEEKDTIQTKPLVSPCLGVVPRVDAVLVNPFLVVHIDFCLSAISDVPFLGETIVQAFVPGRCD